MIKKRLYLIAVVAAFLSIASAVSAASKISKAALAQVGGTLAKQFTYEPFDPPMPDHIWMDAGNGLIAFLHFNKPVTEKGAKVIFIGDGIKGKFCAESQPEGGKTGYVHFHALKTHAGEMGHGGKAEDEGYWLRHIAVGDFEMMGKKFKPGIAYNFMPTPAPECK